MLSCSAFNSAFVANVARFLLKPEFFTRLGISDLSTNSFSVIFASSISFVNLMKSQVVKYFFAISNILAPYVSFLLNH